MSLLQWGDFTLHSGDKSWWRIDCDAFTDSEIELLAKLIAEKVGEFNEITFPISHPGSCVPKLAKALDRYKEYKESKVLIQLVVDDVLTTGNSIQLYKDYEKHNGVICKGAVIFARGECPEWVTSIFQLSSSSKTSTNS